MKIDFVYPLSPQFQRRAARWKKLDPIDAIAGSRGVNANMGALGKIFMVISVNSRKSISAARAVGGHYFSSNCAKSIVAVLPPKVMPVESEGRPGAGR